MWYAIVAFDKDGKKINAFDFEADNNEQAEKKAQHILNVNKPFTHIKYRKMSDKSWKFLYKPKPARVGI